MEAKTVKKYQGKTLPKLLELATTHFNRYIRNRDSNETYFVCISCGKTKPIKQMNAGHYYPALRFDENNVHGQCVQCNFHKHGDLIEYRKRLEGKIGTQALEKLNFLASHTKRTGYKWDRFTVIEVIEKYKAATNEQKKAATLQK